MPRDVNGNYTLPPGNPVIPHTIIESDWANPTCDDIAAALSDSLSRTGAGGMLVPFKNADGTQANPGVSWINEPTSGWYRAGTQDFWYAIGNQNIFRITAAGIALGPGKTAVGISSFINVQDAQPSALKQGEEWFESDTGMLAMRYVNPDLTETLVALAQAGGDFIPFAMKGAPNGVAELGPDGKVPTAQVAGVPPGTILDMASTAVPAGYLTCDGASYATATHPALFAVIGYTWGGAGANFNVPNLNGKATIGDGTNYPGVVGPNVGNIGGEANHVLIIAELAAHNHAGPSHTHSGTTATENQNHTHDVPNTFPVGGSELPGAGGGRVAASTTSAINSVNHTHTFTTGADGTGATSTAGSGTGHNTIQPVAVVRKIIKT